MNVTIPKVSEHGGYLGNLITADISDKCPVCDGPRGEVSETISYDGSRRLACSGWENPCGHIDRYANVRKEIRIAMIKTEVEEIHLQDRDMIDAKYISKLVEEQRVLEQELADIYEAERRTTKQ